MSIHRHFSSVRRNVLNWPGSDLYELLLFEYYVTLALLNLPSGGRSRPCCLRVGLRALERLRLVPRNPTRQVRHLNSFLPDQDAVRWLMKSEDTRRSFDVDVREQTFEREKGASEMSSVLSEQSRHPFGSFSV